MLKLSLALVLISALSLVNADSPDTAWCDIKPVSDKQPNFNYGHKVYQALIEKNDLFKLTTEEIREYFDGEKNIAIAKQSYEGTTVKTYSYYGINELLVLTEDACTVYPLDIAISFTPFYLMNIDGKEQLVSGLSWLLSHATQEGQKLAYTGPSFIRGIPVDNYQLCYFNAQKNATERYTLSISDGEKWVPAENSEYKSIPVETRVETHNNNFFDDVEVYSIHEFKPYLLLEEEGYFTPPNIYCPGRKNIKELPGVPRYFEFLIESAQSGISDGKAGSLTQTKEFYDFDAKLFKMQYVSPGGNRTTELHDFTTGLLYTIDDVTGQCNVKQIDPAGIDATSDNGFTNIRNPEQFFDYDGVDFQFNGNRKMNGVNTGSWIGRKFFRGFDSTFEWSFLTEQWNRTDDLNTFAPTPVRLTITMFVPTNSTPLKLPIVYNFYNFRISNSIAAHHDISQCIKPKQAKTFQIAFDTTDQIIQLAKYFPDEFKLAAYKGVQKAAKVTNIRLQNFDVTFHENHIFFVFDVMEKSEFYGNVEKIPFDDVSLEDAEFHLGDNVKNGKLEVHFIVGDKFINQEYLLVANPGGFARIENQKDGFTVLTNVVHPQGYTTATVAVVSTLLAVVGLLFAITMLVLHKNQKVRLPCLP